MSATSIEKADQTLGEEMLRAISVNQSRLELLRKCADGMAPERVIGETAQIVTDLIVDCERALAKRRRLSLSAHQGAPSNTITIRKKETPAMLTLAKSFLDSGNPAGLTKATLFTEMQKRADDSRQADESRVQAFTRFVTKTDDGRTLYQAYVLAPGPDIASSAAPKSAPRAIIKRGPASERMDAAVTAIRKAHPKLSHDQAIARIADDPEKVELWRAYKAEAAVVEG